MKRLIAYLRVTDLTVAGVMIQQSLYPAMLSHHAMPFASNEKHFFRTLSACRACRT